MLFCSARGYSSERLRVRLAGIWRFRLCWRFKKLLQPKAQLLLFPALLLTDHQTWTSAHGIDQGAAVNIPLLMIRLAAQGRPLIFTVCQRLKLRHFLK